MTHISDSLIYLINLLTLSKTNLACAAVHKYDEYSNLTGNQIYNLWLVLFP